MRGIITCGNTKGDDLKVRAPMGNQEGWPRSWVRTDKRECEETCRRAEEIMADNKWYKTASTYDGAKEKAKKMRKNGGTATIKKIYPGTSAEHYSIYGKGKA